MPDPVVTEINAGGTGDPGSPATIVGGRLTFVGTDFTGVTDVLFPTFVGGWESADDFDVNSDTRITLKVPARAISGAPKLVKGGDFLSAVEATIHGFGEISEYHDDDGQERITGYAMSRVPGDAPVYVVGGVDDRFEGARALSDHALIRGQSPADFDDIEFGAILVVPVGGALPVGVYQWDDTAWQPLPATGLDLTDAHVTNSAPDDVADAGGTIASAAPIDHKHGREGWGLLADVSASAPNDTALRGSSGREAWSDHRHAREEWGGAGNIAASAPGDTAAGGATLKTADAGHRHPREAFSLLADVSTSTPGDSAVKGTSGRVAEADHVHARGDNNCSTLSITSSAPGDAAAAGASANTARVDHRHGRESFGATGDMSASAPGDTVSAGASGKVSDAGHRHAREAFGAVGFVTTSAVGDAPAAGTQVTLSKVDHRHGREAFATNGIVLGTAAAAGAATTPMRSNDTIAAFDATAPSTSAVGDAAAVGSVAFAARRDHVHGREAFGGTIDMAASAVGDTAAAGASTKVANAGHRHAREAFASPVAVGTANAAGSASTVPHSDHVHQLLAEHVPTFSKQGALATAVGALRWYNDTGRTLTVVACRASVGTAPTGASIKVDVNKNGTTIFSTQGNRPTIAISGNTNKVTNPDVTNIDDGDYLTVDIDQIGSTIAGSDLTVEVLLRG